MRNRAEQPRTKEQAVGVEPPKPTPQFRRRAWLQFQRALDPLAPPKPLRRPQLH